MPAAIDYLLSEKHLSPLHLENRQIQNQTADTPPPALRHQAGCGCDCLLEFGKLQRVFVRRLKRLLLVFFPCVSCIVRWKSKKEGLCIKNTENALSPASVIVWRVFFPVRRPEKVSKVVRNCLTTSLKVKAFNPKGALINRSHGKSVCHFR